MSTYESIFASFENILNLVRGVVWGALIVIFVELGILYYLTRNLINPKPRTSSSPLTSTPNDDSSKRKENSDIESEAIKWPENVVQFIKEALQPAGTDDSSTRTESCFWLNVLIHRYFLEMRKSEALKTKWKKKLLDKLALNFEHNSLVVRGQSMGQDSETNRQKLGVEVLDLHFGNFPLMVHGVRLLKKQSENLEVTGEMDVSYEGGLNVTVECTLTGGLKIPVRITLTSLSGRLRLRCPAKAEPSCFNIAFAEEPDAKFAVESKIFGTWDERLQDMVDKLFARKIQAVFNDLWVLPNWRTFQMPLIGIKPTVEATPNTPSAFLKPPTATHRVLEGVASSVAYVSRNISPVLRSRAITSTDILALKIWPLEKIVEERNAVALGSSLIVGILELADQTQQHHQPYFQNSEHQEKTKTSASLTSLMPEEKDRKKPTRAERPAEKEYSSSITNDLDPYKSSDDEKVSPTSKKNDETWRMFKKRLEISIQKRRNVLENGLVSEFTRGIMRVECDAERTFQVISHPEHLRHIDEAYLGTVPIKQYDDNHGVRHTMYRISQKTDREYFAFEVKRRLKDEGGRERYVLAMRTIGGILVAEGSSAYDEKLPFKMPAPDEENGVAAKVATPAISIDAESKDDESVKENIKGLANPSALSSDAIPVVSSILNPDLTSDAITFPASETTGNVHIFGYLIESIPGESACTVTVISQFDPRLQRLEVNWNMCRLIKVFIEELTAALDQDPSKSVPKKSTTIQEQFQSMGKLKTYLSSTKTYLTKNARMQSWFGSMVGTSGSPDSAQLNSLGVPSFHGEGTIVSSEEEYNIIKSEDTEEEDDDLNGDFLSEGVNTNDQKEASNGANLTSNQLSESHIRNRSPNIESARLPERTREPSVENAGHIFVVPLLETARFFDNQLPTARALVARQTYHVDVDFDPSIDGQLMELVWDFSAGDKQAVPFGIVFRHLGDQVKISSAAGLLPETSAGNRVLITLNSFFSFSSPTKGNLNISSFPIGTFTFIFDNSFQKKLLRTITYRVGLRKIHFGEPFNYAQNFISEAVVRQRGTFKSFFLVDEALTAISKSFLKWEFSTGGYDVVFGVLFQSLDNTYKGESRPYEHHALLGKEEVGELDGDRLDLLEAHQDVAATQVPPIPATIPENTSKFKIPLNPASPANSMLRSSSGNFLSNFASSGAPPILHSTLSPASSTRAIPVVPLMKLNSQKGTLSGSIPVSRPGLYAVVFDNSWSLLTSKHIAMKIGLVSGSS